MAAIRFCPRVFLLIFPVIFLHDVSELKMDRNLRVRSIYVKHHKVTAKKAQRVNMNFKKVVPFLPLALMLLLITANAHADTSAAQGKLDTAIDAINALFKSVDSQAATLATRAVSVGESAYKTIIAYIVVREIFFSFLEDKGFFAITARFTYQAIPASLVLWAIEKNGDNYSTLQTFMDGLTEQLNGSVLRNNLQSVMDNFFKAVGILLGTSDQATSTDTNTTLSTKFIDLPFMSMIAYIVAFFYKAAAALVVLLAAVIFIGQMMISAYMMAIGAGVGPIMIPFALLEPTKFLAEGWIKFMIKAGMYQVVGGIIFGLCKDTLGTLATVAATGENANDPILILVAGFATLLIAVLMAYLMMQIPQIVDGLVSGGGGLSIKGFTSPTANAFGSVTKAAKMANGSDRKNKDGSSKGGRLQNGVKSVYRGTVNGHGALNRSLIRMNDAVGMSAYKASETFKNAASDMRDLHQLSKSIDGSGASKRAILYEGARAGLKAGGQFATDLSSKAAGAGYQAAKSQVNRAKSAVVQKHQSIMRGDKPITKPDTSKTKNAGMDNMR